MWVIPFRGNLLLRVSPTPAEVSESVPLGGIPQAVAATDDAVWVITTGDDRLWRVDRGGSVVKSMPLGLAPSVIAANGNDVWVAGGSSGLLVHVDAATGEVVRTLDLNRPIGSLAASHGTVWVTLD